MLLKQMRWSKISYLGTFFPCYLIIGPSQLVFFQVILISCWISLRCYSTHSIHLDKINLRQLNNQAIIYTNSIFYYSLFYILNNLKTMHYVIIRRESLKLQQHFCCKVVVHMCTCMCFIIQITSRQITPRQLMRIRQLAEYMST